MLFVHLLMDRSIVSTFLALVNNAAMDICVPVCVLTPVVSSFVYILRSGNVLTWQFRVYLFEKLPDFSTVAVPLYIPTSNV